MTRPDLTRRLVRERIRSAVLRTHAGETGREIAVRLGVSLRTVERYRARGRETAGAR
jgi:transposase